MRPASPLAALVLFGLTCTATANAQNVITYTVEPHSADKTVQIRMDIPRVTELTVRVQIPVWSPGAYISGNYAANIADLSARDGSHKPLRTYHPDQNTWEIAANGAKAVSVQYTVKNVDLEEANGAPRRGHISGPRTYLYVVGRKAEPVELALATPPNAKFWNVAISLDPVSEGANSADAARVRRYTAPSYDVLADAPIEMGDFAEERFEAGGRPISVVLYGQYDHIDRTKLVDYCKRIAETEIAFFGDAPFHRYLFEFRTTNTGTGGAGGLEHLGSTEIGTVSLVDDRVRSVIAHEYFHLWNVKRIRPYVLGPFDYVDPPRTRNLWWSEGVTSYYGDLLSRRGGLNTDDEYLKHLGATITELQNTPARLKVSADESSLHVFDANNSQGYGGLSYYTKGELVGLCLDLKIRQLTAGRRSLDDVMRALWAQVRHGDGPGFGEDDIKKTVNRVSGHDLSDYYDTLARSTDELPFAECLNAVGLTLTRSETPTVVPALEMTLRPVREFSAMMVGEITPDGAAAKAGLKVGDEIAAANGQTDLRAMRQLLRTTGAGKTITLTILRNGAKSDVPYTVGSANLYPYTVAINPAATPEQVRLRQQWLTGKPALPHL
jgi:predicted metalloprotease with PDZ domain